MVGELRSSLLIAVEYNEWYVCLTDTVSLIVACDKAVWLLTAYVDLKSVCVYVKYLLVIRLARSLSVDSS